MTSPVRCAILLAAASAALSGQRVLVVSEYQRIRPDGETVLADRIEHRREIISPAVARNAWTTFRIVVEAPPVKPYYIYIAQNPDDVVAATLYQEEYVKQGDEWVPDKVKTVAQPWLIYPLEVRVREALAPAKATTTAAPRDYVCGPPATPRPAPDLTRAAGFVARNIAQDLMLARVRESTEPRDQIIAAMLRAGGWNSTAEFCAPSSAAPRGVEWWLRARDYLLQGLTIR